MSDNTGFEIERRFFVNRDVDIIDVPFETYKIFQRYMSVDPVKTIRVRMTIDEVGTIISYLTVKGKAVGIKRMEVETIIDNHSANQYIDYFCIGNLIDKTRYQYLIDGLIWEHDVFHGMLEGLEIVEVELKSEDQVIKIPDWVGVEISTDHRYSNSSLSMNGLPNDQ